MQLSLGQLLADQRPEANAQIHARLTPPLLALAFALLNEALAEEEGLEDDHPAEDLLALEGMDEETAFALASHGVRTSEDLSDLAADEVVEFGIEGLDEARAAALTAASTWAGEPSPMRPSSAWSMGECRSKRMSDATRWPSM